MTEYVGDEQELVDRQTAQDWSMSPAAATAGHVIEPIVVPKEHWNAVDEIQAQAEKALRFPDVESETLQQGIKIADLEAQLRVLNEKLVAVRKAKDGYKAIAAQGCKDLVYVKKMVGMVYAERRADEMQKEFEAVKDEA